VQAKIELENWAGGGGTERGRKTRLAKRKLGYSEVFGAKEKHLWVAGCKPAAEARIEALSKKAESEQI
jgi:hypothetical protein